ncbi:uncharacterized protein LOC112842868 [Oreochromis niloticus]|uniref:uncharacterized protein LOC112842868 n=1 Tax=Oreochromis niloticus TaxID=8128 RepID=UPI000DF497B3|nr:uncharacterized protein LOC112842868 [Oreochromis niloticus]
MLVFIAHKLREKRSHSYVPTTHMDTGSSSVRMSVRMIGRSSLTQLITNLRVSDTALNTDQDLCMDCMQPSHLTKSDTGEYICGYGNPLSPDSYSSVNVLVIDDSNPPASTEQTATTQSESVTAGVSTHGPDSSWLLVVRASLDGVLLMAVFLMLFYISKTRRNFGLNTRENDTNMELSVTHENWDPTSKHKESKSSRTKPTLHY